MANLVKQPTAAPTRKVLMGAVFSMVAAIANHLLGRVMEIYPEWLSWLTAPGAAEAFGILMYFGVSYMMKEKGDSTHEEAS